MKNICLETMSGDIRAAAETSGPLFSGLTQLEDLKTDLLTSTPPMEPTNDTTTMDTQNDEMDTTLGDNLTNLRTDTHDPAMPPTPQNNGKTTTNDKNLPVAQSPHQIDADTDFWSSVVTNGSIFSALLHYTNSHCPSCSGHLTFHHMHNTGLAICTQDSTHRFNRELIIQSLASQNTTALQQEFLECKQYQSINDHSEARDIPTSLCSLSECDFINSNISHSSYPLHLATTSTYEETTSTLTMQLYSFQTATNASIIKSKLTDRLNKVGYCRRIYPARQTSTRIFTFMIVFPSKDVSFKEEMENIIFHFVELNKFEGTELTIYDQEDCCLDSIQIPANKHSMTLRTQIIDEYGFDDELVDYMVMVNMLMDISQKAGKKYTNDTYIIRGKAFTRLNLAHNTTTIKKATMMYLPVSYIKLGQTSKIEQIMAVKMGSLVKENDFYFKHWKTNDVIEINIIRDQKTMEQHLKKINQNLSPQELNTFMQKWRVEQIKLSKSSKGSIPAGKVQVPSTDVPNSPLLNGDIVIVIQKSGALIGRKHYVTVPVNPFATYSTVLLNHIDLYLLRQNVDTDDNKDIIPQKRHYFQQNHTKNSVKRSKNMLITNNNTLSSSNTTNYTLIQFMGKTIGSIQVNDYCTFAALESFILTLCKTNECHYTFNNQLLNEKNFSTTTTQFQQQYNNTLVVKAKLKGGSSSCRAKFTALTIPQNTSNQTLTPYLPDHLLSIRILIDNLPTVFLLRFERNATVQTLVNYFQSQYLLEGTVTSLEVNATYQGYQSLQSISNYTLKFINTEKIKKPKILDIIYNNNATKFPIPQHYTVAITLKRLNDLFGCTGDLHESTNTTPISQQQSMYLHPSKQFFYVPHGYIFLPQQSLGKQLLKSQPVKLIPTNPKLFHFSCLNCHGLTNSIYGINDYLAQSNVNVLILLETQSKPKQKAVLPIISLYNSESNTSDTCHNYWYGTAICLNPKFYAKEQINITAQTDTYVILQLKSIKLVFVYLPPNKQQEYFTKIEHELDENTILMGDLNIDIECPRNATELQLCQKLKQLGLTYIPIQDTHTFCRNKDQRHQEAKNHHISPQVVEIDYTTDRPYQCSKIDHVFCHSNSPNIKTISSRSDPSSFIYSDHKIITTSIELYEDDSFIVGKQSRWKVNDLIPRLTEMLIDNEIRKIDVNEQGRFEYQHQLQIEWNKRANDIFWLREDMYNFHLSDNDRF